MFLLLSFLLAALANAFDVRVDLRGHAEVKYWKTIKLDVGSKFIVKLDENYSTGYSW